MRQTTAFARGRPLVLCYHAVSDAWSDDLAVPLSRLEEQVRSLLRRGYRPTTAADAVAGQERSFHVTFDDAFQSVASALPMLERLGIGATVFTCTSYADDGRPLDVPELAGEAAAHPEELATMRWEDLRELAARGVEIGSHTSTHPHLTRVDDEQLRRELRSSRERLQDELGRVCRLLAYPYGEHDARVRAAARAAGYEAAFALPGDRVGFDRYAFPRIGIWRFDGRVRALVKTSAFGERVAPIVQRRLGVPLRWAAMRGRGSSRRA